LLCYKRIFSVFACPEAAFYMVGGIEEVVRKAEKMAAEAA